MTTSPQPYRYRIGADTVTADGHHGSVRALIVDARSHRVTHLAVEPAHHRHQARLVPMQLTAPSADDEVLLRCDGDTFERLDPLEQLDVIEVGPYRSDWLMDVPSGFDHLTTWIDCPPEGERALRVRTTVHAGDSAVGHLEGVLADDGGRIVAVLADRGHLWRHRTVTVPVGTILRVGSDDVEVQRPSEPHGDRPRSKKA